MDKLRECPFCGATPKIIKGFGGIHAIQCDCGAITSYKFRESKKQAISAWNNRYEPPNEPLTLDELKQMDGKPVWMTAINKTNGIWTIVRVYNGFYDAASGYGTVRSLEDYGKTWLAYRKPIERGMSYAQTNKNRHGWHLLKP